VSRSWLRQKPTCLPFHSLGMKSPVPENRHNTFPEYQHKPCGNGVTGIAGSLNTALESIDQPGIGDQQYLQEVIHRRITGAKVKTGKRQRAQRAVQDRNRTRPSGGPERLRPLLRECPLNLLPCLNFLSKSFNTIMVAI